MIGLNPSMLFNPNGSSFMQSKKVMLSAVLFMMLAGCGSSPESAVESLYKAVAKGELTEAK